MSGLLAHPRFKRRPRIRNEGGSLKFASVWPAAKAGRGFVRLEIDMGGSTKKGCGGTISEDVLQQSDDTMKYELQAMCVRKLVLECMCDVIQKNNV
jgi:hypothetical protein